MAPVKNVAKKVAAKAPGLGLTTQAKAYPEGRCVLIPSAAAGDLAGIVTLIACNLAPKE
jgi:hypothetical protein